MTATAIARALRYPASSAIGLLKSMATLGYLSFDCGDFTYLPTLRLPLLARWITDAHGAPDMSHLVERIHAVSGESVAVCMETDGEMEVLALSPSDDLPSFSEVRSVGDRIPVFGSVVGLTALSVRPDSQVLDMMSHLLRRPRYLRPRIDVPVAIARVQRYRSTGFGLGYGVSRPGIGALAWTITGQTPRPLMLGVWGPAARIRSRESLLITEVGAALERPVSPKAALTECRASRRT